VRTSIATDPKHGEVVFRFMADGQNRPWLVMGRLVLSSPRLLPCSCGCGESMIFARVGITPAYFAACGCGRVGPFSSSAELAAVAFEIV